MKANQILKHSKERKGISLIVLVITIIVIIILAGVVIFLVSKNNPIANANEATFKSDVSNFKSELEMYKANEYTNNKGSYDSTLLQADDSTTTYDSKIINGASSINDIITSLKTNNKYQGKFEIKNGLLVYLGSKTDTKQQEYAKDLGLEVIVSGEPTIKIVQTSASVVNNKTPVTYEVTGTSTLGIKSVDFVNKIKVMDLNGQEVTTNITIGDPIDVENGKKVVVTIDTKDLTLTGYKLKVEAGAVTNTDNVSNSQDVISGVGFDIDNKAPDVPVINLSTTEWTSSETVTITYASDSVKNEYSYDGITWLSYTTPLIISSNCTIYAQSTDAYSNISNSTKTLTNIDKVLPQTASISATVSGYNITGTITLKDNESGIDLTQSKYLISQVSTVYATDDTVWNTATAISSATQSINYTAPSNGDYYIQVLSVDKAGNKIGNISIKVTINVAIPANAPVLSTGMTPIKWDSNGNVVTTTSTDTSWYNYDNKQWANAETADGSMWVWIPRYEYKIPTPHSSTAQTISVNFLNGTSTTATSGYIVHPAFTFGSAQLTGIWVAKFEASGTTSAVDVKPGVSSLRSITISDMFTVSRNMEKNSRYGWGTSGSGIDTHLMKNTEWGAVAYLSSSSYGKTGEVWINPNSNYITGQAGTSVSASSTTSTYAYNNTTYGVNASTTGNVYGIYDMSGGAWEYVAGYVNNSNSSLTTYGSSLVSANAKYKDVYTSNGDTQSGNYSANSSKLGDAAYETSTSCAGRTSWYSDYSGMPYSSGPFFARGGCYCNGTSAGLFCFGGGEHGGACSNDGFRPVLAICGAL